MQRNVITVLLNITFTKYYAQSLIYTIDMIIYRNVEKEKEKENEREKAVQKKRPAIDLRNEV